MNLKKSLSLLLAGAMALSLAACGAKEEPAASTPAASTPAASTPAASTPAEEPAWEPTKTINVIVPFGAGGGTDVMARAVAAAVDLPQGMIITNIEGGGSSIGAMEAYHADPDGHTIFCVGLEALIAGVHSGTYPEADSYEKFIPLCNAGTDKFIVTASKASGITSLEDLVAKAQANPGKITCAGTGSMSITNAATELFFKACDIDVQYVPYDGASKNRAAVMGGHNDISVLLVSEAAVAVDAGDVVPLCVLGQERSEAYPDIPCTAEVGDYQADVALHRAFFCTPGTPDHIVAALQDIMEEACSNPDTQKTLFDLYYIPDFMGHDDLKVEGDKQFENVGEIFASLSK